jgi:agmatine deiminase
MAGKSVSVGIVQMGMSQDGEENLGKALRMVAKAAKQGAQVVCLPELFTAPYFAQRQGMKEEAEKYAETVPGHATEALCDAARENGVALVGGSIYEKDGKARYNTAVVFDNRGRMLGKYRKVHIPQDECFYEKDYFAPGNLGFRLFDIGGFGIAPLICYDQWFPEAARCVALMGADIVFYPTAIGTVKGVRQAEGDWQTAWENVMRGHAIANGIVVAAANRCGKEGRMDFWGGSFVCDAFGKTIARAGKGEEVLVAKIDLEHGRGVKEGWGFFRNRRSDQYTKLAGRE